MFFNPLNPDTFRFLIRIFYYFLSYVAYETKTSDFFDEEYDYIIVGAGSAGSVLASRLSEDPFVKVLLLEAGGQVDSISEIPATAFLNQLTANDWKFLSTPQERAGGGYPNRQFSVPRGKGLGGSSLINCMLYVRGNKRDYDQWAENGATGWSWEEVYPYFLKSEHNTDPEIANNGFHSTGGLLTVSTPAVNESLKEVFAAAALEMGYEYRDINGEKQSGFAKIQGTIRDGRRCSTAKAYLIPAEDRDNLHIVNEAYVQKVLINKKKEAYGVQFEKGGAVYVTRSKKEVILSAGSINSPQILMLSGIGPKEHLENFGIEAIADLPVGDNLQDHVGNYLLTFEASNVDVILLQKLFSPRSQLIYKIYGTGPYTSPCGIEGIAFVNTKYNDARLDWPDVEIHLVSVSMATDISHTFRKSISIPEEVYDKVYNPYRGKSSFTFYPSILRPKSRGTIRLKSVNPYDHPLIDFNLFQHEEDLDKLVDAMKQCLNIVENTTAFQNIGAKMFTTKVPGCDMHEIYSDDYLRCLAKNYPYNCYHPSGTCKMGSSDDPTAVVDPELKVKGIKNLRVVDGSIMPTIVSGNTNAPIIMIAEKASELIKKDNLDSMKCFKTDYFRNNIKSWKIK